MSKTKLNAKLRLSENYKIYLAKDGQPKDSQSNPLNLFDKLNSTDKRWLAVAKNYLSRQR